MTRTSHTILEVGPVHAGIIEPGLFRFTLLGERVEKLEITLGYQHRGVEQLIVDAAGRPFIQMCLAEQIAGDTTIGHAIAMAQILERNDCHPMIAIEREVALEMERVAMNIGDIAALCGDIGYQTGLVACEALRTLTINCMQRLCGSRFGRTLIRPAGSNFRIDLIRLDDILLTLHTVGDRFAMVGGDLMSSPSCLSRFEDICGMDTPVGRYSGDVAHRVKMRFEQVAASVARVDVLGHELGAMWFEPHPKPKYNITLDPDSNYTSRVAGWRGEIVHHASTDSEGRIVSYKISDPSVTLWNELASSMKGGAISDFPINNKSFNLSYCGVDL